jgi:nucleotide-binding universal stress UspA family protein
MMRPRRSHEAGHKRKFLVIVDDTPECVRAILYAAKRASHTGGALALLFVIEPDDFQHWLGVEDIIRAEAIKAAEASLGRAALRAREAAGIEPELVIREGSRPEQIRKLIEEDEDIAVLVLAASEQSEGPGPLVTSFVGRSGTFPIPITIVPETLSDEALDAIA